MENAIMSVADLEARQEESSLNTEAPIVEGNENKKTKEEGGVPNSDSAAPAEENAGAIDEGKVETLFQERLAKLKESGEIFDKETFTKTLEESKVDNPLIQKLIELEKAGKRVTKDLAKQLFQDYDTIDVKDFNQAKNLVLEKFLKEGALDQEIAEIDLEDKYPLLFEQDADTEDPAYARQLKRFQAEATKALMEKKSEQEALALPDVEAQDFETTKTKVIEELKKENAQTAEKTLKAWKSFGQELSKETENMTYEVGENKFDITLEENDKKLVEEFASNLPNLLNNFVKEGQWDVAAIKEFVVWNTQKEKILAALATDAKTAGEETRLKTTKNATGIEVPVTSQDKSKEVEELLAAHGLIKT